MSGRSYRFVVEMVAVVVAVATPLSAKMSMVPWGEVMVPADGDVFFGTDRDVATRGGCLMVDPCGVR